MPKSSLIENLFPDAVATACLRVGDDGLMLFPEEREIVKKAVDKRRREFSAGRFCARSALAALGIAEGPILHNALSAPVWPDGFTGTISHSHTWAGAAVARSTDIAGIGLDIETVSRVSMSISRKVLTPDEKAALDKSPESRRKEFLALVFSAKEAVYKCLAPLVDAQLGFLDASVKVDGTSCFEVSLRDEITRFLPACARLPGRYFFHEGCIFTGIFLAKNQL